MYDDTKTFYDPLTQNDEQESLAYATESIVRLADGLADLEETIRLRPMDAGFARSEAIRKINAFENSKYDVLGFGKVAYNPWNGLTQGKARSRDLTAADFARAKKDLGLVLNIAALRQLFR